MHVPEALMKSTIVNLIIRTIAIVFLIHYFVIVAYLIFIFMTLDKYDLISGNVLSLSALHSMAAIISIPYAIYDIELPLRKPKLKNIFRL